MTSLSEQFEDDLTRMLDVFGGADGGCDFARMMLFMRSIAKKGDSNIEDFPACLQMVSIFTGFRQKMDRIIELSKRGAKIE